MKRPLAPRLFKTLILLAVIGAAIWWFFLRASAESEAVTGMPPVTITKGDIEDNVTAQGKLEPKQYVDVGAQVSGQIEKLHTEIGDNVKTGDLLAEIDPEIYESQVRADEAQLKTLNAQLAQQRAEVKLATQQFKRNASLIKTNAISRDAYEQSETALQVAKAEEAALMAQIEEAQSRLEGDQANLGYTKIYAPMDGTIVVQDTREGQTLNASQTAPTLMQIANLDIMTVRAQVAEADITRIKEGTDVYFTTLGSSERKWQGKVRQVLPSPETVNDVVLYNVLVDVDNADRQLMTGMSTQIFFVLGGAKDVVLIPVSALGKRMMSKDSEDGLAYEVSVGNPAAPETRIIYIGLMDRTKAEVRAGLAAGEQVIPPMPATPGNTMRMPGGAAVGNINDRPPHP